MGAPFVGRERELEAVAAVAARSQSQSSPGAAIVIGDPGSGKSRLLEEVWPRSGLDRRLMVVGYEPERRVPLAAARDLITGLASQGHEGRRLASLVYESRAGGFAPLQVFEGAHRALAELGPVLLSIDDLQWVDETTLALCHYLVRASDAARQAVVIVAASRPSQQAASFARALRGLVNTTGLVTQISLGPLDRPSGLKLAREIDPDIDEAEAERIWEKSAGIPFWLELLAGSQAEETEAVIVGRIAGVGADASTILTTLAVAGRPMTPPVLASLLGWAEPRVVPAAQELLDRGIAARAGPALLLAHDLIRAAAVKSMPAEMVHSLHEIVADWLEVQAGDNLQLLREALDHRVAAGLSTSAIALRLVQSKRRRLLTGEDLRELIAIADEEEARGGDTLELLWHIAEAASAIGQPDLSQELWSRIVERAPPPVLKARAALNAGRAAHELEDLVSARRHLSVCRAMAIDDPAVAIEVDAFEADLAGTSGSESLAPMERAVKAARAMAEHAGGVRELTPEKRRAFRAALHAELYVHLRTGRPHKMLAVADEMVDAAFDSTEARLASVLDSVLALRQLGRYEEAERRCRSTWLEARRLVLPSVAFHAVYMLAGTLHRMGRLEEAQAAATEVGDFIERSTAVIPPWLSSNWIRALPHEMAVSMGDWREAVSAILGYAESEKVPHFRLNIRLEATWWLARFGERGVSDRVAALIELGAADSEAAGCSRCAAEFAVRSAQALCRVGDNEEARRVLGAWDEVHPRPEGQSGYYRHHAGALCIAGDDPTSGARALREVVAEAQSMGARLEETWARIDLGDALSKVDRSPAVDEYKAAHDLAATMGARSEAQKAEQRLRAIGVRTWRRAKAVSSQTHLTDREFEIARLVAQGLSNPEVAEAVFLSRKTIERHVSNIMAKVGARNRTELAAKLPN